MKLITAVVKPDNLDHVMQAISGAGAHGLTVTEVRGFGQQYGHMARGGPPIKAPSSCPSSASTSWFRTSRPAR
jgi:Nitrogen regulatory protein P-II